ncbi:hypothetical protein [uncultured Microbacterium sp.]|uniref:hypothetical protein n=1 Tax=uncultured Microbacterium sp. TaxID=191216 RepID=UPI0025DFB663|nr:hypothetical protein [uncultured Microbacterium sp.]
MMPLSRTAGAIRVVAWLIILGLIVLITWTLVVPWAGRAPATKDVVGTWSLVYVDDELISVTLDEPGHAAVADWPMSLGCTEPLQMTSRKVERMRWAPAVDLAGGWALSESQQRVELHVRASSDAECDVWIPFQFEFNVLTGAPRLKLYVASPDEPYLGEVLIFERTS